MVICSVGSYTARTPCDNREPRNKISGAFVHYLREGNNLGLESVFSLMRPSEMGERITFNYSTKGGTYSRLCIDGRYHWLMRDDSGVARYSWPSPESGFSDAGTRVQPHGPDVDDRERPRGIGAGTGAAWIASKLGHGGSGLRGGGVLTSKPGN
jgi:hypothetical protein